MYQRFDKMQLFSEITVFFKIAFLTIKFVTKQPGSCMWPERLQLRTRVGTKLRERLRTSLAAFVTLHLVVPLTNGQVTRLFSRMKAFLFCISNVLVGNYCQKS